MPHRVRHGAWRLFPFSFRESIIGACRYVHPDVHSSKEGKVVVNTITIKELRPELPSVINRIGERLDRYIVTRRGKPVCIMMSVEDYEAITETLDILSDPKLAARIRKSERELKAGKGVSWEKLKKELESV
jgi:antitoxin YefM